MKTAIKFSEAEELKIRSSTLTEQAMEQVSGGVGAANAVSPEEIKKVLISAVNYFLKHTTKEKPKTFEEFWSKILNHEGYHAGLKLSICHYSQLVFNVYKSWTLEEQRSALMAVWPLI